jgi:multiple sugar transport system permease protein
MAVPTVTATVGRHPRSGRVPGRVGRRRVTTPVFFLILLGAAAFIILPLFWLLSTAFKPAAQAFALPPDFTSAPTLANFTTLFQGPFRPDLEHSAIQTLFTTFIALALGVPAGYAFARARIPGSRFINTWFVLVYIVPPVIFLLPLYIIYLHLGLLNTYPGLILAYETGLLPFTIWLMRIYFADVPRELDEAAWMDGCSKLGTLWRVILPMVWPGLTTVGLLVALSAWGEYFGALILTGQQTETAPVAVADYATSQFFTQWGVMAAAGIVVAVPALIATFFVRRGFARVSRGGAVH